MKLQDLWTSPTQFSLKKTGHTYRFRPLTLRDEVWVLEQFKTQDSIKEIVQQQRLYDICRILFHQMEPDHKEDFQKQTVTLIDESGQTLKEELGGVDLFMLSIEGSEEKAMIFGAFIKLLKDSDAIVFEDPSKKKATG